MKEVIKLFGYFIFYCYICSVNKTLKNKIMDRKVLTKSDITTFVDLDSKIIDAIYKYIEHKYQNICDFWLDSWDILGDRIHFEFGTDDGYIEDVVDIDEFLKICNN